MARAVAYLRVSSDEQKKSGAGIGSQRAECCAHAARLGVRLVSSHADEDVSGAAPLSHRPGLILAIAELEPGDYLIVAKRDRLGRDPEFNWSIDAAVAGRGGRLVSAAGEGTVDDTPESILFRRLSDIIAENFRLVLKARTRAALADRRQNGRRVGQLAYGLELDPTPGGPTTKAGRPSRVRPCETDQRALELIAQWDHEGWSLRQMAAQLTALEIPTKATRKASVSEKTGKARAATTGRWSPSTVRILAARIRAERRANQPEPEAKGNDDALR